jgi:glycosyltransferase involved in cell wall biosynthesis
MKLLRVITSMRPELGGPCHGIRNLNPYLKNKGFKIDVVTFDDNNSDYEDDFKVFKLGKGKSHFYYQPQFHHWLLSHIENYDLIIVHGIWQYHNYAVYKAIRNLKKDGKQVPKVVIMPHGMLDPYFQKTPSRIFKSWRNEIVWRMTEARAINAADAILFTCEEEKELARHTFKGYYPKKEINVEYGIQFPQAYVPAMKEAFYLTCPILGEHPYWLFLSRIHPKKGIDVLIKAYLQLALKFPHLPHLVIAGSLDYKYAMKMIQLANNHPQIHFSGMLKGDAKWGAFYHCDAFVLPSHQENFGIAVAEAMACKKTVVITKHINIWQEINQGGGCILFADNDVDSIYTTLENLGKMSQSQLELIGNNAYEIFMEHFYIEKTAIRFAQALNSLIH